MYGTKEINNDMNTINSKDVINRIRELEEDLEAAYEESLSARRDEYEDLCEDGKIDEDEISFEDWIKSIGEKSFEEWKKDQQEIDTEELDNLKALAKECQCYGDWNNGETLIRESYFPNYIEEFVKDCGDIPDDLSPNIVIDWKATAENYQDDYMEADFAGVTYYMRA